MDNPLNVSLLRLVLPWLTAAIGGALALYYLPKTKEVAIKREVARAIENRKLQTRKQKESIKEKCSMMDDSLRERIVRLSSDDLLKEIASKQLTALQVVQAYRAESFKVDMRTNCITEYLDDAEEIARNLDRSSQTESLHGLPFSVKETYNIKGLDCTAGVGYLLDKPCEEDAVIVAVLKQLGGIFFARTNIVQTTCSFGNSNPTHGATMNPCNPKRIPGGSTCGEGALLGGRGSIVGLGTDIGGSVRIPAAMSGHYSLKPTQKRLSGAGIKPSIPGATGLHDCPGIMSREIQAIVTVFRSLVTSTMFNMDPRVIPLPFQEKIFNSTNPLTVGYYEDDGVVGPTPGCRRAVRVAKKILETMGHKLVPFTIPDVNKAYELTMTFIGLDGGRGLDDALDQISSVILVLNNNDERRFEPEIDKCMSYTQRSFCHKIKDAITARKSVKLLTDGNATVAERSAYEVWKLMAEREDYLDLFIQTMKKLNVDAILAPGYAIPASTPDCILPTGETIFVTMMYNMLNFPVGAVPVTRETNADQKALDNYPTKGRLQKKMKEAATGAVGMPLGVQIIGLPWREELVLRLMTELDQGITDRCVSEEPPPVWFDLVNKVKQ